MASYTRRDFIKISARLAAMMSLGSAAVPEIAEALNDMAAGTIPVIWLQGQSCSGCSVSLLNTDHPSPAGLLTGYISLLFHGTLSTATGQLSMDVLNKSIEQGKYYLVVEGSVPVGMPQACMVAGEPFTRQVLRAANNAKAIIAAGTCAVYGGIPAAENNPTGALGVPAYFAQQGVSKPVIALPGCPPHPDWLVGSIVHAIKFGLPELDAQGRPAMFYKTLVHDQCPRFSDYEREKFARTFGEPGCLFKLGCIGPNTHADCSVRLWNSGTNFCINAGSPCIGCTTEAFARAVDFPFYRKTEQSG